MNTPNTRRGNTQIVVKNQVILNRGLYRWAAPRSVFVRGLVNYRFQDLQRFSLPFINNMRGRCQIKFGMTPLFNNRGFTLIELLVVVLIIGILAAVAVSHYKRAVLKARFVEIETNLHQLYHAEQFAYLENGSSPCRARGSTQGTFLEGLGKPECTCLPGITCTRCEYKCGFLYRFGDAIAYHIDTAEARGHFAFFIPLTNQGNLQSGEVYALSDFELYKELGFTQQVARDMWLTVYKRP